MSDLPPLPPADGAPDPGGPGRVRPTSVELRAAPEHHDDAGSLMDPAAKSLADALRITYRLLQLAMVVLLALFLFSGFESVNQGEQAIRLVFGRIADGHLGPGPKWSLPHPFGQLIKVQIAAPMVNLDEEFWPNLPDTEKKLSPAELAEAGPGKDSLDPVVDGSVITGDGAIAHLKAVVKYSRPDPARFAQAMVPEDEIQIVKAAVRQGIVRAAASMTMDQLLASQGIESQARVVAQAMLDRLDCGLVLEQLSVAPSMPPRHVAKQYYLPQSAESDRTKAIQDAEATREQTLNKVAGSAAPIILAQIDRYGQQLRLKDTAAAAKTQDTIFKLLAGERVEIDGRPVVADVDGEVKQMLRAARLDRDTMVSKAASEAARLATMRRSYAANPTVVLNQEWTDAVKALLGSPSVQVQMLPPAVQRLVMQINRDPNLSKEQYEDFLRKKGEEIGRKAREDRAKEARERLVDPMTVSSH